MLKLHEPPAGIAAVQVLPVILNSVGLALVKLGVGALPPPVLERTTLVAAEVWPTVTAPNCAVAVDACRLGAGTTPVPESEIGMLMPGLPVTVQVGLLAPAPVGVKVKAIVHDWPTASVAAQEPLVVRE